MVMDEHLAYIRQQLHIPDDVIAINAGSWGPLCKAALDTIKTVYEEDALMRGRDTRGFSAPRYSESLQQDRQELARFMNCSPEEVGLCTSSTDAMNIFLWGYEWEPGDEIVVGGLENPAALVPLRVVAYRRKVKLNFAEFRNHDVDTTAAIEKAITPRTRMVLVSHVTFATGGEVDLKAISRIAHQRGILVLADGIQAVGTRPIDVKDLGVDGYAMARHKFLCGPDGAGALYVDKKALDKIHPTFTGVFSDDGHGMTGKLEIYNTAQRFEVSTRAIPIYMAGTATLRWLREKVGWDYIFQKTRENSVRMWDLLKHLHPRVHLLSLREQVSGLLTFYIDGADPVDIVATLRQNKISSRTIVVTNPNGVRVSIGFWNRPADLERIAEVVKGIAEKAA